MIDTVLEAWRVTVIAVAASPSDFLGRDKEKKVFRRFRSEIERKNPSFSLSGPDFQTKFGCWSIDLVCSAGSSRIAIEGKFKTIRDGAVPDNRKAAFFDLFKLEQYVASGDYKAGLFLWLTDEPAYRSQASGDSADFSTHEGRTYSGGTLLSATRARNKMPLSLELKGNYSFMWVPISNGSSWYSLVLLIQPYSDIQPVSASR